MTPVNDLHQFVLLSAAASEKGSCFNSSFFLLLLKTVFALFGFPELGLSEVQSSAKPVPQEEKSTAFPGIQV